MAIITSGQLGKASGSIGIITYSVVEGRTIGRQKPSFVRNPNTVGQQLQRGKMAQVVGLYQQVGPMCAKTFTVRKKHSSIYNEFVSRNIHNDKNFKLKGDTGLYLMDGPVVLGNGSLHNNTFIVGKTADYKYGLKAVNDVFKSIIKVGDTVGLYALYADGTTLLDHSQQLTADDIATLRSDGTVVFDFSCSDKDYIAGYWISADGRKSNSPTLALPGDVPEE